MRRTIKYFPIITSILCSLFMFSVGFSSWYILIPPESETTGGSFISYPYDERVVLDNVDMFEYESTHFVVYETDENGKYKTDESGNYIKSAPVFGSDNFGYIKVQYSFTQSAKDTAKKQGSYTVELSLFYENAKETSSGAAPMLFTSTNIEASIYGSDVLHTPSEQTDRFSFKHSFGSTLPDGFTVIYKFKTKAGSSFRKDFGQYLLPGDDNVEATVFLTSAREVSE